MLDGIVQSYLRRDYLFVYGEETCQGARRRLARVPGSRCVWRTLGSPVATVTEDNFVSTLNTSDERLKIHLL